MMNPEPRAIRLACPSGICGKRCRWPPEPCCSKKRRRNSSNGEFGKFGDGVISGSSAMASASAFWETDMFTTAGDTFFTSGAKLCCWISATGEVNVCGAAGASGEGLFAIGGFSAHTKGESANVAPRPKPIAATRFFLSQGYSSNCSSYEAGLAQPCRKVEPGWIDKHMARQRDGRLSSALIRCNPTRAHSAVYVRLTTELGGRSGAPEAALARANGRTPLQDRAAA